MRRSAYARKFAFWMLETLVAANTTSYARAGQLKGLHMRPEESGGENQLCGGDSSVLALPSSEELVIRLGAAIRKVVEELYKKREQGDSSRGLIPKNGKVK